MGRPMGVNAFRGIVVGAMVFVSCPCFGGETRYAPGELIVKYKEAVNIAALEESLGRDAFRSRPATAGLDALHRRYRVLKMRPLFPRLKRPGPPAPNLRNVYRLSFEDRAADMESMARLYAQDPSVVYALPDYTWQLAVVPNDPDYAQQWAHQNIQSEPGWDYSAGDTNVVIAIVDTGVDWNHPDLASNIWENTDENPTNGVDDDGNGYVDDVRGWDFVDVLGTNGFAPGEDIAPPDNDPMDFYGHGTIVAGVAAAVGSNGIGIAGMSWRCKIMPLRVGIAERDSGNAYILSSWVANAIYYAANNGAEVINLSLVDNNWPGTEYGPTKDAIDFAYAQGAVIVASAGNYGTEYEVYPAAYEKVIGVAATDQSDQRAIWGTPQPPLYQGVSSSYGTWVSVAAPGSDIRTTAFDDTYANASGTSLSAPFVSGLAALILSRNPGFSNTEVMKIVYSTTDRPVSDKYIGTGRINASRALAMTAVPVAAITSPVQEQVISTNLDVLGSTGGAGFSSYTLRHGRGIYPTSWTTIRYSTQDVTNGVLGAWDVAPLQDNSIYTLQLSVTDTSGNTSLSEVVLVLQKNVQAGWPRTVSGTLVGDGVSVGDVDHDGDFEIAAAVRRNLGGPNQTRDLYLFHHDGRVALGWPLTNLVKEASAAPTLADLTGDGDKEIIFSGYNWASNSTTKFFVFTASGSALPGWPQQFVSTNGIVSATPSVGDLDNDGAPEVVFTSKRESTAHIAMMFVFRADGSAVPGWPKFFDLEYPPAQGSADDQASHAALVDLDGDGDLEIVVGIGVKDHSRVYAFHHDGSAVGGWPVIQPDGYTLRPVTGDVDGDGDMEIVGSTGNGWIYAVHANGTTCTGWPVLIPGGGGATTPTLADLDGDGDLEIIVHTMADKVYAYHHDGTVVAGWPADVEPRVGGSEWPASLVADVDGDRQPDIVQASGDEALIYAWHANGTAVAAWPMTIPQPTSISPAFWDMDADGNLEMVFAYSDTINLLDLSVAFRKEDLEWPMSWFDVHHTGCYEAPDTNRPSVVVTTPTNGAVVSGQLAVLASATDDVGVVGVRFRLDGTNLGDEDAQSPYSTVWNTLLATNGSHILTALARDAFGNCTTSPAVTVSVDNSTPDATLPTIVSVTATGEPSPVVVRFSEPVDEVTATNAANYKIAPDTTIFRAALEADLETVTLTTAEHFEGTTYTLRVSNVTDRAVTPNTIAPTTQISYAYTKGPIADSDGDGAPDWWERAYGFSASNPADGGDDADGDGHSNRQEYVAGTDPHDPGSIFRVYTPESSGSNFVLTFPTSRAKTYLAEYSDVIPSPAWTSLATVEGDAAPMSVTNTVDAGVLRRFYRVRVRR